MPDEDLPRLFMFFNEVAIINQLATAMVEARLPAGFVMAQFSVLNHLVRRGDGQTPLGLSRAFQVPKTTMTHTLATLERHGLVRLTPNPADGRSKCVSITDAGRAFRDAAIASMRPDVQGLAAAFPTDRIADVLPVLSAFRAVLDNARN